MLNRRCATDAIVQFPVLEAVNCTRVSSVTSVWAVDGTRTMARAVAKCTRHEQDSPSHS